MPIDLPPKSHTYHMNQMYQVIQVKQINPIDEVTMQTDINHFKQARQQHLRQLAAYALELREQKIPGVQLWSLLTAKASGFYAASTLEMSIQADATMQDLAIVILGPFSLKYLQWFDQITPDLVQDPLVNSFLKEIPELVGILPEQITEAYTNLVDFGPIWRQAGYMSKIDDNIDPGLDSQMGSDFRPEINDNTDNQIFHTFFYQFMAYVTQAKFTIRAASVYHELFDKGGSEQDHTAALVGIETGSQWRQWRNQGQPQMEIWHETILAAYGQAELAEASSETASEFRVHINQLVQKPDFIDSALRGLEYGLIRMVKGQNS